MVLQGYLSSLFSSSSICPIFYYPPTQDGVTLIEYYCLTGRNCPLRLIEYYLCCSIVNVKLGGYLG